MEITSATVVSLRDAPPAHPLEAGAGSARQVRALVLKWFVLRSRLEVTWQEARAHLGLETQRQWNARAIACTTPVLRGLCSMITLWAGQLTQEHALPVRQAVW